MSPSPGRRLARLSRDLAEEVAALGFGPPVAVVLHPVLHAWELHRRYCERFAREGVEALLLGMNPGPWGMVQTGVPFGEVAAVRDWMGLRGRVEAPPAEHPKRPVLGLACPRSEVSGRRLWGWARERFGRPEAFFERFFVWNWCPAAFLEESGRNLTPDRLPAAARAPLEEACDRALAEAVALLRPRRVLGVGAYARRRARSALGPDGPPVGGLLHPSPASPAANRGWQTQAEAQLREQGLRLPDGATA